MQKPQPLNLEPLNLELRKRTHRKSRARLRLEASARQARLSLTLAQQASESQSENESCGARRIGFGSDDDGLSAGDPVATKIESGAVGLITELLKCCRH